MKTLSLAHSFLIVAAIAVVGAVTSRAEWPARYARLEEARRADALRGVEVVESGDGEHMWLINAGKTWVGAHNDQTGTWIDLRSAGAKSFPEFAVWVPKDGGAPKLQVCRSNEDPITVDLVKAAKILNRLIKDADDQ